jgi:hypothetical protein
MGILRKIVEKLDDVADKKIAEIVEKAGIPPKREPSPKPVPKAELSVVAPTPLSGGCSLRLLRAAGFAGVVAVTASAALVGRYRR